MIGAAMGLPQDPVHEVGIVIFFLAVFLVITFIAASWPSKDGKPNPYSLHAYLKFAYNCFLKPHTGDGTGNQQDALESFYSAQASIYDATRAKLLTGREDMLGLVAAQLKHKVHTGQFTRKPVWVDVGGGTGYNIEAMSKEISIPEFFEAVYIVDLSPSLLEVARKRFERLGWKNVHVICQDARRFRLHEHLSSAQQQKEAAEKGHIIRDLDEKADAGGAELVTMSFSLSMIPEFHSVVDSLSSLLAPSGIIGVCDFYVQSAIDYQGRNYTGGFIDRHCMWISRVFWRTWFEVDRVNLEPARRDYLEYRFGTIISVNQRNRFMGVRIPYYIWIGCAKENGASIEKLAELDCAATESPFLTALDLQAKKSHSANAVDVHSKSYECALVNLAASLPLPAAWYQNHHWRIYFEDQVAKTVMFNNSYIYAFTWEDSRVDARLLKVKSDDVILALTSAGDNILSFALESPRRIHAVDLNPAQNHLLELKVAAFTALGYADVWKMFGEGRHDEFRNLLVTKLSPHMSSLAFQFWLTYGPETFNKKGLYLTGGSGHALRLVGRLFRTLRLSGEVDKLCSAQTLNEQREIWNHSLKHVVFSRILAWTVVGNEKWLWKALGVPPNQRNKSGHAIWEYIVNTLEPVVNTTLLSEDNHYYYLCLKGRYSRRSHPEYLTPRAHIKLNKPDAFDGLRIHTDEINEVIARISPGTLTIAVVMDSMDWFDPAGPEAATQIRALNRVLKNKGRVMLRSSGLSPWYIETFEELGFRCDRVGMRMPGTCIDRVNMYASTWICTKVSGLEGQRKGAVPPGYSTLEQLKI
ncbi:betaine lipid synthase [Pseudovirgaria hyperparasitica]|uniref:Betaine lipid synthase n=1 Tax=Pseudovirgaria hyperparasitica TaxID=470096 RepID=A0A6A6WEG7_9PEZI|nr:betaine lipid synthase [Pseudovirgaria hyperparasitica]KAF2761212.1 betaine lipid synthase [Pseudovirgaria hyperparasitica]